MSSFGQALDQLLVERGITQAALARRLDVTSSAVNLWVKGRAQPSRDNIERIEDELAVEPRGELLSLAGYAPNNNGAAATIEGLIRADPGFDAEDKRVLLRMVRVLRERHAETQ